MLSQSSFYCWLARQEQIQFGNTVNENKKEIAKINWAGSDNINVFILLSGPNWCGRSHQLKVTNGNNGCLWHLLVRSLVVTEYCHFNWFIGSGFNWPIDCRLVTVLSDGSISRNYQSSMKLNRPSVQLDASNTCEISIHCSANCREAFEKLGLFISSSPPLKLWL